MGRLSVREQEVLELLTTGASNEEIARKLQLSQSTVMTHFRRIAMKQGIEAGVQSILRLIERFAR